MGVQYREPSTAASFNSSMDWSSSFVRDAMTAATHAMVEESLRQFPNEATGIVWNDGLISPMTPGDTNEFTLTAEEVTDTLLTRPDNVALALFHSHPSGSQSPSSEDQLTMHRWARQGVDILWSIVALQKDHIVVSSFHYPELTPLHLQSQHYNLSRWLANYFQT